MTDDRRQTTDGRTTTYSEREHEFTFAKNERVRAWWQPSKTPSAGVGVEMYPTDPQRYTGE